MLDEEFSQFGGGLGSCYGTGYGDAQTVDMEYLGCQGEGRGYGRINGYGSDFETGRGGGNNPFHPSVLKNEVL